MIGPRPICIVCRHYSDANGGCAAFPGRIPEAIWQRRADHRQPFEGDGGIRFEPDPDLDPQVVSDRLAFDAELRRRLVAAMEGR